MTTLPDSRKESIERLCRLYAVSRLELFGSMSRDEFIENKSDVDFLVTFATASPQEHADRYFGLLAALQDEFGCAVDLVEADAVKNPYFMRAIDKDRTLLYAG